eukprot:TRINITY_DN8927_c2_g1_i1.p1 TRINITY_DN8927_c2_g1~~TRINITY_DN8927_c2_g1_i1.p1  ORF type:complete len:828 (+),score=376.03 TRINITY_DN8927_c2_g1_i1:50-2533(+)
MAALKSYDHVRDEGVMQKFLEEREVMKQLTEVRADLKKMRGERDELLKKENPKQKAMLDKYEEKLDALHRKKDELHQKKELVNGDPRARIQRNLLIDKRKLVAFDLQPVESKCTDLLIHFEGTSKKIKTLEKQKEALQAALTHKSTGEVDSKMREVDKKLKTAEEKNQESLIKQLRKEKRMLEQSRTRHEQHQATKDSLAAESKKLKEIESNMAKTATELEILKKQKEKIDKELDEKYPMPTDEDRKNADEERFKIGKKIDDVQKEIFNTKEERRRKEDEFQSGPVKAIAVKIIEKNKEREALESKLTEINNAIPKETITIDRNLIGDLVGPGGATVKQIEEDFGVVIDVRRNENEAVIKGSECKECAEAVQEILQRAQENRHEETIEIDPECGGEFIGSNGSHIQQLQSRSGTNINYTRGEGKVVVIGSKENVEQAIALIKEFKDNSVRTEVTFGPHAASIMRVHLMKQWQEEFGCRLIKVDQEAKKISIMGKQDCVERAKKEISEFLEGMQECGTVHIPYNVPHHVIIGTKGERVNHIQAETKCVLDVSKDTVKIAGSKENIDKAKKLVMTIIAENVRDEVKVPYKAKMHNFLIRRRTVKEEHIDPTDERSAKRAREGLCLLEQLRLKYNCDRVQADLPSLTVTIRGPKDAIKKCRDELKAALEFTGMEKEVLMIDQAIVRYLTQNLNDRGTRGVRTRLDAVRNVEGVEEVTADFRGESKRVELIGTKEGVAAAKEKLEDLAERVASMMLKFDIDQSKVGRLLGRGGTTVSGIEREFEVMFHVPRTDRSKEPAPDAQMTISIIGEDPKLLEEAREAAINAIADYK